MNRNGEFEILYKSNFCVNLRDVNKLQHVSIAFIESPVSREIIEELMKIDIPSGNNGQGQELLGEGSLNVGGNRERVVESRIRKFHAEGGWVTIVEVPHNVSITTGGEVGGSLNNDRRESRDSKG